MPWWIWLLLALFMVAMLVAGVVYAALHGMRGLRIVGEVGEQIGDRMAAMGEPDQEADRQSPPVFTAPLRAASERYTQAQAAVVARRQAKRERHARQWADWNSR